MPVKNRFAELQDEITAWRRDFHEHPEILFDTVRTAGIVAEKLREFGCDEVTEGIGNKELALALMRGQSAYQKSDTARMTRWLFDEDAAISNWLGIERQIRMLPQQGSNPSQPTRDFPPRLTRAMPGRVAQIPSPSTARCSASPDRAPRSTPTQAWSRSRSSGRAPRIC